MTPPSPSTNLIDAVSHDLRFNILFYHVYVFFFHVVLHAHIYACISTSHLILMIYIEICFTMCVKMLTFTMEVNDIESARIILSVLCWKENK